MWNAMLLLDISILFQRLAISSSSVTNLLTSPRIGMVIGKLGAASHINVRPVSIHSTCGYGSKQNSRINSAA